MLNFEGKIKVCPACEGWGIEKGDEKHCKTCNGNSVYILEGSRVLTFDVPMYIDYGLRVRIRLLRSIVLVAFSICSILILILLIYMIIQILS